VGVGPNFIFLRGGGTAHVTLHGMVFKRAKGANRSVPQERYVSQHVLRSKSSQPIVKIASMAIIRCPRTSQSLISPKRFSSRFSTHTEKSSTANVTMRGFGMATRAGSSLRMCVNDGARSCSRRPLVYTCGSSSRSTQPDIKTRFDISRSYRSSLIIDTAGVSKDIA
jgi:hypothetical protein